MRPSRGRLVAVAALVLVVAAGVLWWRGRGGPTRYVTAKVDRGNILEVVGATGTLEAVTTVQVGSQVSGTIQTLYADFNSLVRKGEVIARLDPSLFEARLKQTEANLVAAEANLDRARASVEDTRLKLQRARELAGQQLLPQSDLDTARANHDAAVAEEKANQATVSQARASVNQARVDLSHTVIAAPIDGVVVSRNVDVGQTVAASFQAPVLFVIANDLSHMRVKASVDEADVGRVHDGERVTFRVDAYPEREFTGRVEQVRLNPTVVQNVVSYDTIVAVDNEDLLLRPGMTATVSIVVREADNALRVPVAALRFRPEGFAWPRRGSGAEEASPGGGPPGGGGWPRAARAGTSGAGRGGRDGAGPGGRGTGPAAGGPPSVAPGGERPSVLFVAGPDGTPVPARVRIGLSDGQFVEVRSGLEEGESVIVGTEVPGAVGPRVAPTTNPFSPQFQRRQR